MLGIKSIIYVDRYIYYILNLSVLVTWNVFCDLLTRLFSPIFACFIPRSGPHQVREELRAVRGLWPEDPWPIPDERGRCQLARAVPGLLLLWNAAAPHLLRAQLETLLQDGLRPAVRCEVLLLLPCDPAAGAGDATHTELCLPSALLRLLRLPTAAPEGRAVHAARWPALLLPSRSGEGDVPGSRCCSALWVRWPGRGGFAEATGWKEGTQTTTHHPHIAAAQTI